MYRIFAIVALSMFAASLAIAQTVTSASVRTDGKVAVLYSKHALLLLQRSQWSAGWLSRNKSRFRSRQNFSLTSLLIELIDSERGSREGFECYRHLWTTSKELAEWLFPTI